MSPINRVRWRLWIALTASILVYQISLGGGILYGKDAVPQGFRFPLPLAFIQIAAATFFRWILIPRAPSAQRLLIWMIFGLALSESVEFFAIYLVPPGMPETKMRLFYLSLVSAAQFAPLYGQPRGE